jgi:hypothetical protein
MTIHNVVSTPAVAVTQPVNHLTHPMLLGRKAVSGNTIKGKFSSVTPVKAPVNAFVNIVKEGLKMVDEYAQITLNLHIVLA